MTNKEQLELCRTESLARYDPEAGNRMVQFGADRWRREGKAFGDKLRAAMDLIRQALRSVRRPKPYSAFSGGKDSTVATALAQRCNPKTVRVWSDDELEYPETVQLMRHFAVSDRRRFERVRGTGPHAEWFEPWEDRPFFRQPAGVLQMPDVLQWQADLGYNVVILGTRAKESSKRAGWFEFAGPVYRVKGGVVRCCPIWDWTDADVWTLIAGWGLRYNAAYDRFDRMGLPGHEWRIGPLPLAPRLTLQTGWPNLLADLEQRYGQNWN